METCKYQTIRVQNNARLLAKRFDLQLGRESYIYIYINEVRSK